MKGSGPADDLKAPCQGRFFIALEDLRKVFGVAFLDQFRKT
jgi:hypothetical protein